MEKKRWKEGVQTHVATLESPSPLPPDILRVRARSVFHVLYFCLVLFW